MEYLVDMTTHVPDGTSEDAVADVRAREAARTRELAAQGHILRLWRSEDAGQMRTMLDSLPMARWLTEEITPLVPHPSDPAAPGSRPSVARAERGGQS